MLKLGVFILMLPITCGYHKIPYWTIYYFSFMSMICLCSKFFKFILFADDINIFFFDKSIDYCFEIFNNELINLSQWFKTNKLFAKFEKQDILFFGRGKKYSKNVLTIDDTVITRVISTKFLGVIISEDLK